MNDRPQVKNKRNRTMQHAVRNALLAIGMLPALAMAADDPIKLGLLTSFGGSQVGGKTVLAAARMAVDDFGGTVLGRKIELLVGDEQYKPDVALSVARQWVDQEK